MFHSAFALVALVVNHGYASAQLNHACIDKNAFTDIIIENSTAADCLALTSFFAISTAATNATSSLIPPIDNWLTNFCKAPICSNATLAGVIQNITEGCAADFRLNITTNIEQFYPVIRRFFCLKNGNTNCITELLDNIQAAYGQITAQSLSFLSFDGGKKVNSPSFPPNITCTNCNKAIYNELQATNQSNAFDLNTTILESQCGASFIDGKNPPGVTEIASNSTGAAASSSASSTTSHQ